MQAPASAPHPSLTLTNSATPSSHLQAGLDWYGTNENSAALFLAGQQLTTSDSEFEDDWGALEEGEAAPQGNGHAHDDAHSGGSGSGGSGGGGDAGGGAEAGGAPGGALDDEAALPRAVRARLVEQEAYIAELEDQNLRWVLCSNGLGGCCARMGWVCRVWVLGSLLARCARHPALPVLQHLPPALLV